MTRLERTLAAVALVALAAFVLALTSFTGRPDAGQQIRAQASRAAVVAANAPPAAPICNPAPGSGTLGACAPRPALTPLTGQLRTIRGTIGVDVSSYQCPSSLPQVSFVFIKASEGTRYTDPCLARTVAAAKRQHIPYGDYDFLRPGSSSATAEANHFVAAVRTAKATGSLPPVADVEANAGLAPAQISRYVCTWHSVVRKALHRTVSITYTGNWFWTPQVHGSACGSKLWVSAYGNAAVVPAAWRSYTIWQFSDGTYGPFPHVNRWDTDVFAGSTKALHSLLPHKAKPRPRPVPKPTPRRPSRTAKCPARFPLYNSRRGRHPQGCYKRFGRFHLYASGRKVPAR